MNFIFQWLQKYINRLNSHPIFEEKRSPNHVLINEYEPGQGIMVWQELYYE